MYKNENNYAFIDSQNLNLAIRDCGWKLDYRKFRIYLWEKYRVKRAFLFIGYIERNKKLYYILRNAGYEIIFKPTIEKHSGEIKGNCDAELVLHCMLNYQKFDKAVIVSGDGDFYCLVEQLLKDSKLKAVGVPNKKKYSELLRKFYRYHFYINKSKQELFRP